MLRILEYKCDYNSVVKTAEGGGRRQGQGLATATPSIVGFDFFFSGSNEIRLNRFLK